MENNRQSVKTKTKETPTVFACQTDSKPKTKKLQSTVFREFPENWDKLSFLFEIIDIFLFKESQTGPLTARLHSWLAAAERRGLWCVATLTKMTWSGPQTPLPPLCYSAKYIGRFWILQKQPNKFPFVPTFCIIYSNSDRTDVKTNKFLTSAWDCSSRKGGWGRRERERDQKMWKEWPFNTY